MRPTISSKVTVGAGLSGTSDEAVDPFDFSESDTPFSEEEEFNTRHVSTVFTVFLDDTTVTRVVFGFKGISGPEGLVGEAKVTHRGVAVCALSLDFARFLWCLGALDLLSFGEPDWVGTLRVGETAAEGRFELRTWVSILVLLCSSVLIFEWCCW